MVNTSDFSKRLQKIIDFYDLTATSFSEKIAFNRSTISHILSGRNKPSLEFVIKVLEAYPEVDFYWLLNGKGSFPTDSIKQSPKNNSSSSKSDTPEPIQAIQDSDKPITTKAIERIVIFYKDGTFSQYNNSQ